MSLSPGVGLHPVAVGFAPPSPQRRVTVAFRIFLAIPHLVFGSLLSILVFLPVLVASWFCALVLGRVPARMHGQLVRLLRYWTRVNCYVWLLTDRYPPFALDNAEYPIDLDVSRSHLNRAAVLFRVVLLLPAGLVTGLVGAGMGVLAPLLWLITLIKGRMPRTLFEAVAAVMRYQARYAAYACLLTPTYPAGLFGDPAAPISVPIPSWVPTQVPIGLPAREITPASIPMNSVESASSSLIPPPPPPPPTAQVAQPPSVPLATRLVLSVPARRLVKAFLVLGLVLQAGNIAFQATLTTTRSSAVADVNHAYRQLIDSSLAFRRATVACGTAGGLSCVQPVDDAFAAALTAFADRIDKIDFPKSASSAGDQLIATSRDAAQLLHQLASTTTVAEYQAAAPAVGARLNDFDRDYRELANVL